VQSEYDLDLFAGAIFIFRAKRTDRLKIVVWDGTGLVLVYKRIEGTGFVWPKISDSTISLTRSQFEALFEGLAWTKVRSRMQRKPMLA